MFKKALETENRRIMDNKIKALENYLEADVINFYGPITEQSDDAIKQIIEELQLDEIKHRKLAVILTTNGGSLSPVERIVNVFRNFYEEVYFIIPNYAYSAGTIMCMSADKIYMNYYSVLGPIDPQVRNKEGHMVPALNYLDKISEMLEKDKKGILTDSEFLIVKDFDLAELREYEQARDLAITILQKWLVQYKFRNWAKHKNGKEVTSKEKEKRAVEIAKTLSDNKKWKTHGRPINMEILTKELKLKIEDYGANKELKDLIDDYYEHMIEFLEQHKRYNLIQTRRIMAW